MTVSSFDKMIEQIAGRSVREQHRDEIERAIKNAKRTAWDRWWRRQWHRAAARRRGRSSHQHEVSGERRWIENANL